MLYDSVAQISDIHLYLISIIFLVECSLILRNEGTERSIGVVIEINQCSPTTYNLKSITKKCSQILSQTIVLYIAYIVGNISQGINFVI